MDNDAIAERLRKLRGKKSRAEVAKACGITISALTMYETGKRIPRDVIKIKTAKDNNLKKEDGVYNIKDDYLIGLDKFSKKKYFDY